MTGEVMDTVPRSAHHERMGGIGIERREVEFEPLPDEAPGQPEPREQPAPPKQPEREPVPA